jgi:hypothetical protein
VAKTGWLTMPSQKIHVKKALSNQPSARRLISGRGAIFSGELVTRPPPDGRTGFAGYANIKSVMRRRSFYRVSRGKISFTIGWEETNPSNICEHLY